MGLISSKRYKKVLVTIYRAKTSAISKFAFFKYEVLVGGEQNCLQ